MTRTEADERRYTYGGKVSHLLLYGSTAPYALARCGYAPSWPAEWLGSGSQGEQDEAARLPVCKRCEKVAATEAAFREVVARHGHGFVRRKPCCPTCAKGDSPTHGVPS